jgi:hypothetical protein
METVAQYEGRNVPREQVNAIPTPLPTSTWRPISHMDAIDVTLSQLDVLGYRVVGEQHTLANHGKEYFGQLQLQEPNQPADRTWGLMLGIRNSHTKRFALRFAFGQIVFVCSNGAFYVERGVTGSRKHTSMIYNDLPLLVRGTLERLPKYTELMAKRETVYRSIRLDEEFEKDVYAAGAVWVRSGVIPGSKLKPILDEYMDPTFEAFRDRTLWSFFNATTHVMKDLSPQQIAEKTRLVTLTCDAMAAGLGPKQEMHRFFEQEIMPELQKKMEGQATEGGDRKIGFHLPAIEPPKFGPQGDPGLN